MKRKKWIIAVMVLMAFFATALGILFFGNENDSDEIIATGAWETGTIIEDGYRVTITGPKVGHPDPESDWYTSYEDPQKELDLEVRFNFTDELPEQEEAYPRGETQLWGENVVYEEREMPNRVNEDLDQKLFVGYLELGPDKYLQIQIFGIGEEQTTLDRFLEDILFQGSFHIACEKKQ